MTPELFQKITEQPELTNLIIDYNRAIHFGLLFYIVSGQIPPDATQWDITQIAKVGAAIKDRYRHRDIEYKFDWKEFCWRGVEPHTSQTLPVELSTGFPVVPTYGTQ